MKGHDNYNYRNQGTKKIEGKENASDEHGAIKLKTYKEQNIHARINSYA
jgi:hypothetical protein